MPINMPGLKSISDIFKPKEETFSKFDFYLRTGNEYWIQRNYTRALKSFDAAIELNPEDSRPWNNKGIVNRNLGNIEEARRCFKKALEFSPRNPVIKRNLKSLDKPIASGTPMFSMGLTSSIKKIVPMLQYEIPQVMGTAVVIVSAILFVSLFSMFKSSETLWADNFSYLTIGLTALSLIIILIAVLSQIHYLIPIIEYEIRTFLIYLLGVVFVIIAPIHESLGIFNTGSMLSGGNLVLYVIGIIFIGWGTLQFYFKGGYFLPWILGIIIFMIAAFHESFKFIIFSNSFGAYDQATAVIGIILTFIGFFLFLSRKIVNMILVRSENLRGEGRFKEALRYQNIILKLNPYNEVAWNDKGNVYFNLGNIEEAKKCYTRALELDKGYDIALWNLNICNQTASVST